MGQIHHVKGVGNCPGGDVGGEYIQGKCRDPVLRNTDDQFSVKYEFLHLVGRRGSFCAHRQQSTDEHENCTCHAAVE